MSLSRFWWFFNVSQYVLYTSNIYDHSCSRISKSNPCEQIWGCLHDSLSVWGMYCSSRSEQVGMITVVDCTEFHAVLTFPGPVLCTCWLVHHRFILECHSNSEHRGRSRTSSSSSLSQFSTTFPKLYITNTSHYCDVGGWHASDS